MEKGVLYLVLASLVLALILSQACSNSNLKQEISQDPTVKIVEISEIVDEAIKTKNPSLCNQIEDQGYRDQCVKLVSESQK